MERDNRRRTKWSVNGKRRTQLDYDAETMDQSDDAAEGDSGSSAEENT
jgi:hypothetical protein